MSFLCKRMWHSIQEYCKKINREISAIDIISLLVTCFFLVGITLYLYNQNQKNVTEIVYTKGKSTMNTEKVSTHDPRPFASRNGKTYTFSWCGGSTRISESNKIYFSNEVDAQKSGRTLSKLCSR